MSGIFSHFGGDGAAAQDRALYSCRSARCPLTPELLEILACPACKTPVVLVQGRHGLKCESCHRVYPIKDDIPVMLLDEATSSLEAR